MSKTPKDVEGHSLGSRRDAAAKYVSTKTPSGSVKVNKSEVDDLYRAHEKEIERKSGGK